MKKLTPRLILFAFAGLLVLASCEYDYYVIQPEPLPPVDTTGNDTTVVTDTISFSQDLIPFFTAKCEICHKGSTPPDLRPSKAYSSLINGGFVVANKPNESSLYLSCKPGGSMKAYCSAAELKLMERWILAGAKNN